MTENSQNLAVAFSTILCLALLITACNVAPDSPAAGAPVQSPQNMAPFFLEFTLEEEAPDYARRGNHGRKILKVMPGGSYEFTQEIIPPGSREGYSHHTFGVLHDRQLTRLRQLLAMLEASPATYIDRTVLIREEAGGYPGLSGQVKYSSRGRTHDFRFTSHYSPAHTPSLVVDSRLSVFIQEMRRFLLLELSL